jgi:hypothetical protein
MGKQRRHLKLVRATTSRRHSTLLDLVRRIQDMGLRDEEVVATISQLIESGEVVLCSTFSSTYFEPPVEGSADSATADKGSTTALGTLPVRFARQS